MKKINENEIADDKKPLFDAVAVITEAVDRALEDLLGEKKGFALIVFENGEGILSGNRDAVETIDNLKSIIDAHEIQMAMGGKPPAGEVH